MWNLPRQMTRRRCRLRKMRPRTLAPSTPRWNRNIPTPCETLPHYFWNENSARIKSWNVFFCPLHILVSSIVSAYLLPSHKSWRVHERIFLDQSLKVAIWKAANNAGSLNKCSGMINHADKRNTNNEVSGLWELPNSVKWRKKGATNVFRHVYKRTLGENMKTPLFEKKKKYKNTTICAFCYKD